MCKHIAAVLYGVGARLDEQPDLLFTLRQVDAQDLITTADTRLRLTAGGRSSARVLEGSNLSELFGLQLAEVSGVRVPKKVVAKKPTAKTSRNATRKNVPVKRKAGAKQKAAAKKRR